MPERTCIAQIAERVRRKCTLFGSIGAHRLSTCKYLSHGQQTNEPEIREPCALEHPTWSPSPQSVAAMLPVPLCSAFFEFNCASDFEVANLGSDESPVRAVHLLSAEYIGRTTPASQKKQKPQQAHWWLSPVRCAVAFFGGKTIGRASVRIEFHGSRCDVELFVHPPSCLLFVLSYMGRLPMCGMSSPIWEALYPAFGLGLVFRGLGVVFRSGIMAPTRTRVSWSGVVVEMRCRP